MILVVLEHWPWLPWRMQRLEDIHCYPEIKLFFQAINELGIEPKCPVDGDLLDAIISALSPEIVSCELGDEFAAYQLQRFAEIKKLISTTVQKRLKGKRLNIEVDWRQKLDEKLSVPRNEKEEQAREEQARKEKAAALKELAEFRISVLIGPAGTGKTTLLSNIMHELSIARNGILLLSHQPAKLVFNCCARQISRRKD